MELTADKRITGSGWAIRWTYVPFVCCAASVLGLTLWTALILWQTPYAGLRWSQQTNQGGVITDLAPGGPAARAGVRPGDRVLAVDGRPLTERHAPYPGKRAGDSVALSLQRGEGAATLRLTLADLPAYPRAVIVEALLVGLALWGLGLVVWAIQPFHPLTRLSFFANQTAAAVMAAGELSVGNGLVWAAWLLDLLLLLLAALVLHFYTLSPLPLRARWRRPLLRVAYGGAVLWGALLLAWGLLGGTTPEPAPLRLGRGAFIALVFLAGLLLLVRRQPAAPLAARRRRRLILAAIAISPLPLLTLSFLPDLARGRPLVDYIWTFPLLIVPSLAYAYALSQRDLGRVDRLLHRAATSLLLAVALGGAYVPLFLALTWLLSASRWISALIGAALALTIVPLHGWMRVRVQRWVDRVFFGGWYDYRSVVRSASAELSQARDLADQVGQVLRIARTMRFRKAVLLWPDGAVLAPRGAFGCDAQRLRSWRLPEAGALASALADHPGPCWQRRLVGLVASAALTPAERAVLADARPWCWLPLVSRGQLRGVLALAPGRGEEGLDREDREILAILAQQAAVAAENATLAEALQTRLREVEGIRRELTEVHRRLEEGREAERLRLAQELHDGPVQDLFGARFHLDRLHALLPPDAPPLCAARATLERIGGELRAICGELRPPALAPFGLEVAIRAHLDRVRERAPGLSTRVELHPDGQALPEGLRLALFRIYQEALNNAVQHAAARSVTVRLAWDETCVTLEVQDDGRGFSVPARWTELAHQGHLGLLGATERAAAIGGRLEVASAPGRGTTVRATVPAPCGAGTRLVG